MAENFHYDRKKKSSSHLSGGCVSFWFWQEIGSFFVAAGKKIVMTGKKVPVVCLAGVSVFGSSGKLAVFLSRREKNSLRPEKQKVPVVCLAGVSVFGSGRKWAVFLLWQEIFITSGKKKVPVV